MLQRLLLPYFRIKPKLDISSTKRPKSFSNLTTRKRRERDFSQRRLYNCSNWKGKSWLWGRVCEACHETYFWELFVGTFWIFAGELLNNFSYSGSGEVWLNFNIKWRLHQNFQVEFLSHFISSYRDIEITLAQQLPSHRPFIPHSFQYLQYLNILKTLECLHFHFSVVFFKEEIHTHSAY